MKKIIVLITLVGVMLSGCTQDHITPTDTAGQIGTLEISFMYNRQEKDYANNQFAVWIEDVDGNYIKTLYVTRFTATKGYKKREESLPRWVKASGISSLSKKQVDAFTSATPKRGSLTYIWDGRDEDDHFVEAGEYHYFVEGTILWENGVTYSGRITLGDEEADSIPVPTYTTDEAKGSDMIQNVEANYKPM